MEPGGGERAKLELPIGAAGSEDRLSALPDDILVLILGRLGGTRFAVRTSVLSRRWRRVWALLPRQHFKYPDPRQIAPALEAQDAPLLLLSVMTQDASPDSVAAWLPLAARRVSGRLFFVNHGRAQEGDDEEAAQWGAFELPCLERARDVSFDLGFLGLAVSPAGVFARLSDLYLSYLRFHGPGLLGDAVSWPRCPCLRRLTVRHARGLEDLAIHSDSLRKVKLSCLRGLRQLSIVAPVLKKLKVSRSFFYNQIYTQSQPVASITAPKLATLRWMDSYDPSSVHLGEMKHLRLLKPFFLLAYGREGWTHNQSCLSLLGRFKVDEGLILNLKYLPDIDDYDYMMEDMTMLPDITILQLKVLANGHAFGASAFHVLRMCSSIKKLTLSFAPPTKVEAQTATCPPGCICGQHQNWETEHLLLNRLREVAVTQMIGSEHEVNFVKQLFNWATSLEKMRVFFHKSVTESMIEELSLVLRSFVRPDVCLEFYTYLDMLSIICSPKDKGSMVGVFSL